MRSLILDKSRTPSQDAQNGDLLTRPPWRAKTRLVRRQARSSAADPRFTFHASRFTVPGSEARTKLADFFSILLTVSLLLGLILSRGLFDPATTLAVSDQPAVSKAGPTEDVPLPLYTPPKEKTLTPRARVGGGLRGTDGNDPVLVALVPDHVGLTVKQAPSLNWFLSKPTSLRIRFTLIDSRSINPLHEGPIPTPDHAGVQSINLKDLGLTLEPDVQYRWYISAIRNPDSPSQDIVAGGIIERCEFSTCLVEMEADLSCDRPSVLRNAGRGFWYDAMSCLCDLIKTNQKDASLRRMRAALLKQVGLNGVAEWDLKSAPPEK